MRVSMTGAEDEAGRVHDFRTEGEGEGEGERANERRAQSHGTVRSGGFASAAPTWISPIMCGCCSSDSTRHSSRIRSRPLLSA